MANRFPLIIDTDDGNKFKELPVGDNLNLQGSGIVNASSIQVQGNLDVLSLTVNQQNLSTVAVTGDYNDLDNVPISFSGSYNDLTNKPTIPTTSKGLTDVSNLDPEDGQILVFNAEAGRYEPTDQTDVDLSQTSINALQDVITTGATELKYLKYQSGAWRPSNINYSEILNKPVNVTQFVNDAGYIGLSDLLQGDPLVIGVDTSFDGLNVFSRRNDFLGNFFVNNTGESAGGSFDVISGTVQIIGDGALLLTAQNGDLEITGLGLHITDGGSGTTIRDDTVLQFTGQVDFNQAQVTNLNFIDTVEAPAFKGNVIANNLDETVLVNTSTEEAQFSNLALSGSLNIQLAQDPTSPIGSQGDTAGELRIGLTDTASTRYLYHCTADYDGVSAIWYRVAMTNNW